MNISLPPPEYNLSTNTNVTVQANSISTNLSVLSNDRASDLVKAAVLRYRIEQIIKQNEAKGIVTSLEITDLRSGRTLVEHESGGIHYAASINKMPVALLLLEDLRAGKIQMDDTLTWQLSDAREGFGTYDQPGAPLSATVSDLIYDMLNRSGNTAVRALVNQTSLGGAAAVNARLAQYPQLPQTRLQPLDATRFFLGNTTAGESLWTMEQVQKIQDSYGQFMRSAMATNIFASFGVRSQLEGNSYISLANKVGILDDPTGNNRHDTGVIYNARKQRAFAYSIMTTNLSTDPAINMQAEASLQQIGRDLLRFAGDKPQRTRTAPEAQALDLRTRVQLQLDKKVLY